MQTLTLYFKMFDLEFYLSTTIISDNPSLFEDGILNKELLAKKRAEIFGQGHLVSATPINKIPTLQECLVRREKAYRV